jgi:RPA family protein
MTEWTETMSYGKPAEFETESSAYLVYQRRNIRQVEDNGEKFWMCEERTLTKAEYSQMREAELEEELTQTQLAMVEMYESLVIDNG